MNTKEEEKLVNKIKDFIKKKEKGFSMKIKNIFLLLAIFLCSLHFMNKNVLAASSNNDNDNITVSYYTHISDIGWEKEYSHKDGNLSGTTGKAKPIEAIYIKADNLPKGVTLTYRAHVRNIGWQKWVKNGKMAGTTGKAKSIEAIEIKLKGTSNYIVQYRVHVRDIGWQDWVENGSKAGTTGKAKPIEAIQIRIIKREGMLTYQAHVQNIGWMKTVKEKAIAGTTGKAKSMEALVINKTGYNDLIVRYRAYVKDKGWKSWVGEGKTAGTTGKGKPIEAVQIKFKKASDDYSIMYRVHVRDVGWMNWCYDGARAGIVKKNKPIEAIQIKIVPKPDKMKVKMYLDSPSNKTIKGGKVSVKGWVMTTVPNTSIKIKVDGVNTNAKITREKRSDVIKKITGYGTIKENPKPGFKASIDFSKYSEGSHKLSVQIISKENEIIAEKTRTITISNKITYGSSGLKVKGDSRGSDLQYYKIGNGSNVLFAVFTLHGFEDGWYRDGVELYNIANDFYNKLSKGNYSDITNKWTIYIFPEINPDGRKYGTTNNGPGRNTLFSKAPGGKGIDLNRCWQTGSSYIRFSGRNYNGTGDCQAYEAQALKKVLLDKKSKNGQTVLVDLHGWLNQLIGDSDVSSYYKAQIPSLNTSTVGQYGTQYLIKWARSNLGSKKRTAKTALVELPAVSSHQDLVNKNLTNKYINATINMLRNTSVPSGISLYSSSKPTVDIKDEQQYKVALAGMIKNDMPNNNEVDNLVAKKTEKSGIWISENSRKEFLEFVNSFNNNIFEIDEEGYLQVKQDENKKSGDIVKAIKSKKEYIIDMTGNYYLYDDVTGKIIANSFEQMDPDQSCEYIELTNKKAIFITSNKKGKLNKKEIYEAFIEMIK